MTDHTGMLIEIKESLARLETHLPLLAEQVRGHHDDLKGLSRWRWLTRGGIGGVLLFSSLACWSMQQIVTEVRQAHDAVIHQQDALNDIQGRVARLEHR